MKAVALVSGGKDSCYGMTKCSQYGHKIVALATLLRLLMCLIFTLCVSVGLSTTTISSPDGDIIDCVPLREQSAFNHPLLQNHEILETPTYLPNMIKAEDEFSWQIWHGNGTQCPEGTIPIRRYAIGFLNNPPPKVYGGKVTMNVWQPKVEQIGEFSLGQIWVISGGYNNNEINSIEAGWQVFPELYLDYQPRFFIFWTRDAYTLTRCYNLRCPGFIQTNRTILIEGAISPTSTFGVSQFTIQIWKDPKPGPWWLGVGLTNGTVLAPVGYWPTEIFTRLIEYAQNVQWGGEIVNKNISGRHTTTEMGSGYLSGNAKAAYMRDLEIAVNIRNFQPVDDLGIGATNPAYYSIKKFSNTSFSYGGSQHAGAVHLRVAKLFYLCLGFFLIF